MVRKASKPHSREPDRGGLQQGLQQRGGGDGPGVPLPQSLPVQVPQSLGGQDPQPGEQVVVEGAVGLGGLLTAAQTEQGLHAEAAQVLPAGLQGAGGDAQVRDLLPAVRLRQGGENGQKRLQVLPPQSH